jgi:hypothetical protein
LKFFASLRLPILYILALGMVLNATGNRNAGGGESQASRFCGSRGFPSRSGFKAESLSGPDHTEFSAVPVGTALSLFPCPTSLLFLVCPVLRGTRIQTAPCPGNPPGEEHAQKRASYFSYTPKLVAEATELPLLHPPHGNQSRPEFRQPSTDCSSGSYGALDARVGLTCGNSE